MRKGYSILILPWRGTRIRRFGISRVLIGLVLSMALLSLGLNGWLLDRQLRLAQQRETQKEQFAQVAAELGRLKAKYKDEFHRLRTEHNKQVITLKTTHVNELSQLKSSHSDELATLITLYDKEVSTLRDKHHSELTHVKTSRSKELKALKSRHRKEVSALKGNHDAEVTVLTAQLQGHKRIVPKLKERISTSRQLLAGLQDRREKVRNSLPQKHEPSLNGQQELKDVEKSLASLQADLERLVASVPSRWPTHGRLTSGFGSRRSPWTGKWKFHPGLDIANRRGTQVFAPADAIVEFAGRNGGLGRLVVLNHGQGITTHYGHLSKIQVKQGDEVRKDQKIGTVGSTGKSTNPHLHYEVRVNGVPIDPRRHLLEKNFPTP